MLIESKEVLHIVALLFLVRSVDCSFHDTRNAWQSISIIFMKYNKKTEEIG